MDTSRRESTHVHQAGSLLRRLAGQKRKAPPQIIHQPTRRSAISTGHAPKKASGEETVASVLTASWKGRNQAFWHAAKYIIAAAGSLHPSSITKAHALEIDAAIASSRHAHSTKAGDSYKVRQLLNWLHETWAAPNLKDLIRRYPGVRPRTVTAQRADVEKMLTTPNRGLLLWLLLCSDLAIRSGTAARISPQNYNPERNTLTFATKGGAKLTLPVTAQLRELLQQCDPADPTPCAAQLWNRKVDHTTPSWQSGGTCRHTFAKWRAKIGLTRRITPHDLRRTTAVAMLRHTYDLRDVQSLLGHRHLVCTLHYLDHDLRPIAATTLEALKKPFIVKGAKTA